MNYSDVLHKIEQYVTSLFEANHRSHLYYHNLTHTRSVVSSARQIATYYHLDDHDSFVVMAAAWFHDSGYLVGPPENHEQKGAELAETCLKENGTDAPTIDAVKGCILATKMPQHPVGLLQQILCDADLFHLGTADFQERSKLLRKEMEVLKDRHISKDEWRAGTLLFLEKHEYYTDYARSLLNTKVKENEEFLRHKLGEHQPPGDSQSEKGNPITELLHEHRLAEKREENPNPGKEKKKKVNRPERGVDTVFRITSSNNQRLSSQADSKAHIMIQVNSIIVSVLLSLILRKIEEHHSLAIPTFMLLTTNIFAIIFSVLATRPNIPHGTFTAADLDEKKVNLLFFGNFYKMSLEDYASGMLKMMEDSDFLYGSLIRDVYFQGIALGRKYRHLRISYNIFMFGLIASVLAFVIAAVAVGN
jgi:predicted metal-dependent HD superfamily phosphohydrolase